MTHEVRGDAVSPLEQGAIVAIVGFGAVVGALAILWVAARSVATEAEKTKHAITSSPWTGMSTLEVGHVRIGAVLAVDDEMLIELRWEPNSLDGPEVTWLIGPTSVATIVALSRWRDTSEVVAVRGGPDRYLLHTQRARVKVHATGDPDVSW
jgi:hypothetical protein